MLWLRDNYSLGRCLVRSVAPQTLQVEQKMQHVLGYEFRLIPFK
jgi:hypothetical protein